MKKDEVMDKQHELEVVVEPVMNVQETTSQLFDLELVDAEL